MTKRYKYLIIEKSGGGETLNIESHICHNALQLVVNKNDPTLFDNPEIFEKNLIDNGASKSDELTALKLSLIHRIPWEVRKNAKNLTSSVVTSMSLDFSQKSKVKAELSNWVIDTWIAVLGLKKIQEKPVAAVDPNLDKVIDDLAKSVQPTAIPSAEKKAESVVKQPAVSFDKVKGRFGIVFGEDSAGDVKVFNTWYDQPTSEESSSMAVTPVKLESEPVRPFKTAPKRKKEKLVTEKKSVQPKPVMTKATAYDSNIPNQQHEKPAVDLSNYTPTAMEQKAYDMLKQNSMNANQALKILAPIAVGGSILACRKMGEVYYKGYGVLQNFEAAHAWLKLSADKGDAESLFLMGNMYMFGMGVKKDLVTAKQFFERAAKQGHAKAAESLKLISMGL